MSSSSRHGWYITGENEADVDRDHYDEFEALFSIKLHHGGIFTDIPGRKYLEGKVNYIHCVHRNEFNNYFLPDKILKHELGYKSDRIWSFYYILPGGSLDQNIYPLSDHYDYMTFLEKTEKHRIMTVYLSFTVLNLYLRPNDERTADRNRQIERYFDERISKCP